MVSRLTLTGKIRQVVGVTGFEPVTLRLSSACSNQLSYTPARNFDPALSDATRISGFFKSRKSRVKTPKLVELRRLELPTYSLQSYRSTN